MACVDDILATSGVQFSASFPVVFFRSTLIIRVSFRGIALNCP